VTPPSSMDLDTNGEDKARKFSEDVRKMVEMGRSREGGV
jgi:GST-like protein